MAKSKPGIVEAAALVAAAIVCVVVMLRSAGWSIDGGVLMFLAWAVSPYLTFWLASRLFGKFMPVAHIPEIAAIIAVLMLAFTLLTYVGSSDTGSSTDALIYVVVPVYLYVGSLFLLALGAAISWLFGRRNVS